MKTAWTLMLLSAAAVTIVSSAHAGYALDLNGTNAAVVVPHSPDLSLPGPFTLEAWVLARDYQYSGHQWFPFPDNDVVGKTDDSEADGYMLLVVSGHPCVDVSIGGHNWVRSESPDPIELNRYYHLAGSWDGDSLRIFVDGVLKHSLYVPVATASTDGAVVMGSRSHTVDNYWWNGLFGEIRLSSVCRYVECFAPPETLHVDSETVGLWRFDEGSGVIATDASGHGHDGTIVNAGWSDLNPSVFPNLCDPQGACCDPSGTCLQSAQTSCLPPSVWQGDGTTCEPNPCLVASGAIVAWGRNAQGECNVPAPNSNFVAIATGTHFGMGLRADSSIVLWGGDYYSPVPEPNAGFVAMSAGYMHCLGLRFDGSIVAWGWNADGQCNVPAPNADFVAVAAGYRHSLGLKSTGLVVAWGWNTYGQCNVPAPNADFVAIDGGYSHSLGLKADGSISAWGHNNLGQCDIPAPDSGFTAIAAGDDHNLGLKSDGSIVAWGWNGEGECNIPDPNTDFVAVAAGNLHSLGLKSDGRIVAWESNDYGECDVPNPNSGFVAVAGGERFSLGLRAYPGGACCHVDGGCTLTAAADCQPPSLFLGDGVICYPSPCPSAGACCQSDGTCTAVTEAACPSPGFWQGAGTTCDPNPCLAGACCIYLACEIYDPAVCAVHGGSYQGNGTLCDPNPCPTSAVGDGQVGGALRVQTIPNPSTGDVSIVYQLPTASAVMLEVFGPTGSLVRRLSEGLCGSGQHAVVWDGRDDAGRAAPAGIYLVRLTTPSGDAVGRLVKAR